MESKHRMSEIERKRSRRNVESSKLYKSIMAYAIILNYSPKSDCDFETIVQINGIGQIPK